MAVDAIEVDSLHAASPSRRGRRRATSLGLVVLGVSFVLSLALAAPPTKAADAPYPADFRTRLHKAIQKGIEQVRADTILDEPRTGRDETEYRIDLAAAAAIVSVLRRAGLEEDPALAKAMKVLGTHPPKRSDDASLVLFALCVEAVPLGDPLGADGTLVTPRRLELESKDRESAERAVKLLLEKQITKPAGEPGDDLDGTGGWAAPFGDMKVEFASLVETDLAVEALEAAARSGIEVPGKAFSGAIALFLRRQQTKGPAVLLKVNEVRGKERVEWTENAQARGFDGESSTDRATGSATAACAAGLVVCQDALQSDEGFTPELKLATRTAIRDALAWLQQHFDASKNPVVGKPLEDAAETVPEWRLALLRLGVHAKFRFLGSRDWYPEVAKNVMKAQKADGSFGEATSDTSEGLRFLMRASLASKAPALAEPEVAATK